MPPCDFPNQRNFFIRAAPRPEPGAHRVIDILASNRRRANNKQKSTGGINADPMDDPHRAGDAAARCEPQAAS
jgi:hypothetical protein